MRGSDEAFKILISLLFGFETGVIEIGVVSGSISSSVSNSVPVLSLSSSEILFDETSGWLTLSLI